MKQTKLWLATIAVLLCSITVNAHDFEVDGIYYNITSDTDLTVEVSFRGPNYHIYEDEYSGAVSIPTTVTYKSLTYSVAGIKYDAFRDCRSLTSITIPEGVTSIGDYAFCNCRSLTAITIPENSQLTSIGVSAFSGCSSLTSITIPESVTSIENGAFAGCSSLTEITIPEGVTYIGTQAFYNCVNLASITIPESMTSIGDYAFSDCISLTSINIPEGVTSIGGGAFSGCTSLTAINIPENSQLDSIGDWAFYNCVNLASITIPESVTSIGDYAFYYCNSLASITIPESVTSIGDYAFYGTAWYNNQADGVVYIGKCLYQYKGVMPQNSIIEVRDGTVSIGYKAFWNCHGLTTITIPESVTSIGNYAFVNCSNLTTINIPESVTSIGDYVFEGCNSLTAITIPESVTSIGNYAFVNCRSLTSITIPESVTAIEDYAFLDCSKLTEVTFKSVVAPTFGEYVFRGINDNAILNYPEGSDYSALKRYFSNLGRELLNGVAWIVEDDGTAYAYPESNNTLIAYSGEKTVKRVYAYDFSAIDSYVFFESSIEEFYLFGGCESINDYAFSGCKNLKTVCLPMGLKHIGISAFNSCESLKYICLPEGLEYIGEGAFDATGLEFLVIPESVMYIGEHWTDWGSEVQCLWIFKNLYGRTVMESLPQNIRYMVPEGAIGYENCGNLEKEYSPGSSSYYIWDDKIFVFGGISDTEFNSLKNVMNDVNKIEVTPDVCLDQYWNWCGWVQQLPSTVTLEVLKGGKGTNLLYSIEGSNAIFRGDNEIVAGYVNSVIPYGTKKISSGAFKDCLGLTSIEIPQSVTSIDIEAFEGCYGLDSITVDGANPVYDSRDNCNAIIETQSNKLIVASQAATLPLSVTSIGERAFSLCNNIDLTIPSKVTCFGLQAFGSTKNLYFESSIPPTIEGDIFGWGAIFVPSDAYDSYCNADVWSKYKDRIVTEEMAKSEVEVWSTEGMSGILNEVGLNEVDKVVKLKVKGEINSYDMIVMRDKMPLLQEIDLSEATVVASSKPFYQTYCTGNNSLGSHAFYDLDKLVSIKLPKDLTTLGDYGFYGCERLKSVDASATKNLYMGEGTFASCSDLQEFVAPLVISELGVGSFSGCRNLKNLDIHKIAGSVEKNVFNGSGIEILNIDSVGDHISSEAFSGCTSLKEFMVGTLVGNLGNEAFHGCSELKSVEFAKGPQKIGSKVFKYADKLETFVVGEGAEEISDDAFYACKLVYRQSIFGWDTEEVEIIRTALKRVVLPESIQKIGSRAFRWCTSLSDFSLPQNVTSIGASAFEGCASLKSITIPSTLTTLADKTFSGCGSLENVTLPDGLSTIGSMAFDGCSSLTDIALPNSLTTIADRTFYNCGLLENVTFPDGLTSIGTWAFSGCDFGTLKLPPMLRTIDENAFSSCISLTELHIPSSVEHIGSGAFAECKKLNAVYTYTVEPTEIAETTFSTFASATLYVPATSFWNYYWSIGWSRFNHKNFKDFNEKYDYFYLNNDYYLNGSTGYIEGTPDADLRPGSGLIVEADKNNEDGKQNLGEVNVSTDAEGNSAAIIGDDNLYIENLNVKINVKGGRWYFFAFPWNVSLDRISMQEGSDYVFRYYDGEERAKNGHGGWKDVNESHLKAARGYIFQSSDDDILVISVEDVKFSKADKYNELVTHSSQNLNDASWNLMGNPYLSYYDMAAMDYSAPVTVWDGSKYVAIRPGDDDYQFTPYEAFFVQKPEGLESVGFSAEEQLTKSQAEVATEQKARRVRSINPNRLLINLELSDETSSDRTRVVFNNSQSHNYETACDAAKFKSTEVSQIYTIDNEGVQYAINERPVGNGVVYIGYTAVENGYYTIEASRMDTKVFLYDAETKILHNLAEGAYTFFSDKGTYEARFSLGVSEDETTGIKAVDEDATVESVEGGIYFKGIDTATIYNAAGVVVAVKQGAGLVQLPAGTYVVSLGKSNTKVVVK